MADRPILFSGPMVRALLAGTKTQTRRKLDAWTDEPVAFVEAGAITALNEHDKEYRWPRTHAVGDRLYVRETWASLDRLTHNDPGVQALADHGFYKADNSTVEGEITRWTPGIHMPRWASRLTLTVTDVRVERLQDCSEEDARAEGVQFEEKPLYPDAQRYFVEIGGGEVLSGWDARDCYGSLWEHINGSGSWAANPWVVAYTFTVQRGNIDQLGKAA